MPVPTVGGPVLIWRMWSFFAGLPLGALVAWALLGPADEGARLTLGALAGGVALLSLVSFLARRRDDDPGRTSHLASAACVGFAAWPALGSVVLGLPPGPGWLAAITLAALAVALVRGARMRGPSIGSARRLGLALVAITLGALVSLGISVIVSGSGSAPEASERLAISLYDIDAKVVTRALPTCAAEPARIQVRQDRGARPRLTGDDGTLWFDAADADGRRQLHRLVRDSGEVTCWTCAEAGNNARPFPSADGRAVVFETDRHARWWDPTNTEVQLIQVQENGPLRASRRLTYARGPDDHALLTPGLRSLVWSRRDAGHRVVTAAIRQGHGGVVLGPEATLARGGAVWIAPIAWSPDARSLVVVSGNPFRPLVARRLDLAAGTVTDLGDDVAPGGAAFNGDGGFAALAGARRRRLAGLLPSMFGGVLAPFATDLGLGRALLRDTDVRVGASLGASQGDQAPLTLALGEVARWGEPTGLAMTADGRTIFLAQRRADETETAERILEISLDCS